MKRYLLFGLLFVAGFATALMTRSNKTALQHATADGERRIITIIKPYTDREHSTDIDITHLQVLYRIPNDPDEYEKVRDILPADGQTWVVRIGEDAYYAVDK